MEYISLVRCIHNGLENYCILYCGDNDGLFCDENKRILSFSNINTALLYLSQKNLSSDDDVDITTCDFDSLGAWAAGNHSAVNCADTLYFWNLFTDIASTTGKKFKGDKKNKLMNLIYDKLFYGNNLPSIKPEDAMDYVPIWDSKQINIIKAVMADGVNLFRKSIDFRAKT